MQAKKEYQQNFSHAGLPMGVVGARHESLYDDGVSKVP
jgi:hypothetical protein